LEEVVLATFGDHAAHEDQSIHRSRDQLATGQGTCGVGAGLEEALKVHQGTDCHEDDVSPLPLRRQFAEQAHSLAERPLRRSPRIGFGEVADVGELRLLLEEARL
jgi:hypothetical protein